MKKLILFLIVIIHPNHSQCYETKIIEYSDGSFGEYIGCLDDFGASSGKGILKTDNYQKKRRMGIRKIKWLSNYNL